MNLSQVMLYLRPLNDGDTFHTFINGNSPVVLRKIIRKIYPVNFILYRKYSTKIETLRIFIWNLGYHFFSFQKTIKAKQNKKHGCSATGKFRK